MKVYPSTFSTISKTITTTESGNIQFLSAITTDHSYVGLTRSCEAGENLSIGNVCYLKSDGLWYKAQGNAYATTAGQLVICTEAITYLTEATFIGLLYGYFYDSTQDYTVGGEVWISKATGGLMTKTQPTTPAFIRCIGYGDDDADTIFFNPSDVVVEI